MRMIRSSPAFARSGGMSWGLRRSGTARASSSSAGNSILAVQTVCRARDRLGIELDPSDVLGARSLADLAPHARSAAPVADSLDVRRGQDPSRHRAGAVVAGAGAAVVSAPALSGQRGVQRPGRPPPAADRSTSARCNARWPPYWSATRCCAPTSRRSRAARRWSRIRRGRSASRSTTSVTAGPQTRCWQRRRERPSTSLRGRLCAHTSCASAPRSTCLALTFHHLVFDGWSVGVLCASRSSATPLTRPAAPPRSLRSPSGTETSRPGSAPLREPRSSTGHVGFWCDRLRGVRALQLPPDGPAPERGSGPGRGIPFALPGDVAQGIRQLSHELGATPFATLLAGFQALLSRHTGQHDLAVAVPMAGRTRSETEDLIGFFVNTLVVARGPLRQPALRGPPGTDAGQPARGAHPPGGALRADRRGAPPGP